MRCCCWWLPNKDYLMMMRERKALTVRGVAKRWLVGAKGLGRVAHNVKRNSGTRIRRYCGLAELRVEVRETS